MNKYFSKLILLTLSLLISLPAWSAEDEDFISFDDFPLNDPLTYPTWFKKSFLDLPDDLEESVSNGKKGLIVYFGQKRCPYCRMLMDVNFKQREIAQYTQQHFDVVPVDIWSIEEMTDMQGETLTQQEFAQRENTSFTPSLMFYDADGKLAMKLRGYYAPYQFLAALQYVAEGHYKREKFKVYLARGDQTQRFEKYDLIEEDFFSPPPFNLDRSHFRAQRPLVVFFEQGNCHACDVLHAEPLKHRAVAQLFYRFDSIQLDMNSDVPVITPSGEKTTAKEWADQLNLFYAPSMVFFDEEGREIIRVDSVVRFFRLRNVLNYVLSGSYKIQNFQQWRTTSGF
jgi:thioredoxin-related protein